MHGAQFVHTYDNMCTLDVYFLCLLTSNHTNPVQLKQVVFLLGEQMVGPGGAELLYHSPQVNI